jgi:deoxyribonuclease-1
LRTTLILLFLIISSSVFANPFSAKNSGNMKTSSFYKAKKLMKKVYSGHRVTLYCGCKYSGKKINHNSCNYTTRKNVKRSRRLEWEHVVPAHAFGHSFREWRIGHPSCVTRSGRKYKGRRCAKKNRLFKMMESDLYNLYPSVGEVNGDRSNYSMSMISGEARRYGKCDVEIKNRKIEPRPKIRGDIARTYLYMHSVYPRRGIISKKNRKLFKLWNKQDPVDAWECKRAKRIEKIQKNENRFVKVNCQLSGLW